MNEYMREAILPIIFSMPIWIALALLIIFHNRGLKKGAKDKYSNLSQLLGDSKWSTISSERNSLRIVGTFMDRKVQCVYMNGMRLTRSSEDRGYLEISSKPHSIPKKLPWYTFKYTTAPVYKDYFLNGEVVKVLIIEKELSTERCNEILTDLNHACGMVESGEYELD